MSVEAVTSPDHFKSLLSTDLQRISLINFWAPWAAPCEEMNKVVGELAKKYPQVLALQVDADEQEDIAESFEIEAVPTFIILRGHTLLGRVNGADGAALTTKLAALVSPSSINPKSATNQAPAPPAKEETAEELNERLKKLMTKSNVVLFMKGEPDEPRCGFSRTIVKLLRDEKVEFTHFDILTDESVRSGLKSLNNWPTFPQLIVKGEFVGGLDVVKESIESGEFREQLE